MRRVTEKVTLPGTSAAGGTTKSHPVPVMPAPSSGSIHTAGHRLRRLHTGDSNLGDAALTPIPNMDAGTSSLRGEFAGWDAAEPEAIEKWVAAGILSPEETRAAVNYLKKLRSH